MNLGARRGFGLALLGLVTWVVALVVTRAWPSGQLGVPGLLFALIALAGMGAFLGGLIWAGWSLFRHDRTN